MRPNPIRRTTTVFFVLGLASCGGELPTDDISDPVVESLPAPEGPGVGLEAMPFT